LAKRRYTIPDQFEITDEKLENAMWEYTDDEIPRRRNIARRGHADWSE